MEERRKIVMIAAIGLRREIGASGKMPWRIPSDMKRFRELTRGHSVIMGRTTFISVLEAIRKPLPGRQNIIMSRAGFSYPGVTVASSLEDAVDKAEMPGPVFVAGGGQIYALALPLADEMWLTTVHGYFPESDVYFPPCHEYHWLTAENKQEHDERDSHATTFRIWRKVRCDL
jgi:dihydrofolate reductase